MSFEEQRALTGFVASLREWTHGLAECPVLRTAGAGHLRRVRLEIGVQARAREDGGVLLEPILGGGETSGTGPIHRIVLEWGTDVDGGVAAVKSREQAAGRGDATPVGSESGESPATGTGDTATLRRRLELVLGGPPGFTTGARADILVDLLREFPAGTLLEVLIRDWVQEFDTGAESSKSVGGAA